MYLLPPPVLISTRATFNSLPPSRNLASSLPTRAESRRSFFLNAEKTLRRLLLGWRGWAKKDRVPQLGKGGSCLEN